MYVHIYVCVCVWVCNVCILCVGDIKMEKETGKSSDFILGSVMNELLELLNEVFNCPIYLKKRERPRKEP